MGEPNQVLARSLLAQSQEAPRFGHVRTAEEARKTAEDFEAFFLAQMTGYMFSGIPTDGPFGGGQAEDVYRSLLNNEYGKALSRTGGIGIADEVYREILKLQEIDS